MRLWHIDLIPYLPKSQLLAQWRELNSIFKKQDKHILINYIYDYKKYELRHYSLEVIAEMRLRSYKVNIENYLNYFKDLEFDLEFDYRPRFKEHNIEYLTICYYNLREKYLRGQKDFTKEVWYKLDEFYKKEMLKDE